MPKIGRKVKIFSALEVANICGVVNQTAINWIKNGYLKAFTTPGGQYRIYAKDLAAFLDNRGMGDSGEALQVLLERANWTTILIATADITLNDRLHEEIDKALPEFTMLHAYDGFEMGLRLAGEKPGFILLDMDLPGVDHDRLLKILKRDPVFGKPFIFIMVENSELKKMSKFEDSAESGESRIMRGSAENTKDFADKILSKPPNVDALIELIKDLEKQTEAIA